MNDDKEKYDYENIKINEYISNNNKKEISIDELKIDDIIKIEFIPDSQKYIYDLYPKFGKIISINNDNNIIIKNLDNNFENLLHDSVSYYGDSLGYSFIIFKIFI